MQLATAFYAEGPMDVRSSQNAKCYFSKFHPKYGIYFPLISNGQKHVMSLRNTFSPFQYSLETNLL